MANVIRLRIDDCRNCPVYPDNHDLYWGLTSTSIGGF